MGVVGQNPTLILGASILLIGAAAYTYMQPAGSSRAKSAKHEASVTTCDALRLP